MLDGVRGEREEREERGEAIVSGDMYLFLSCKSCT